jgi:hypothetical protein
MALKIELQLHSAFEGFDSQMTLEALRKAMSRSKRHGLRYLHYGVTRHKVRLIAEARDQSKVEKSMRSLTSSLGRQLWSQLRQSPGKVSTLRRSLVDRYKLSIINNRSALIQELRHLFVAPGEWLHSTWRFFNRWHRIRVHDEDLKTDPPSPSPNGTDDISQDRVVLSAPLGALGRALAANDHPACLTLG